MNNSFLAFPISLSLLVILILVFRIFFATENIFQLINNKILACKFINLPF